MFFWILIAIGASVVLFPVAIRSRTLYLQEVVKKKARNLGIEDDLNFRGEK